jgi:putative two-component system hydrogenase maturation factor HypX/HoxX
VTEEAVALFDPDVVLAPFLKRAIPGVGVVAPAVPGAAPRPAGRPRAVGAGPCALEGQRDWGVTVLQATADFDAGTGLGLACPARCAPAPPRPACTGTR